MSGSMKIPGLRSPRAQVGGIVYFGRMLDKIRLHAEGRLGPEYVKNLGTGFDARILSFLKVSYDDVIAQVQQGLAEEEILAWAFAHGRQPSEEEIEIWNGFMIKRGWKDAGTETLLFRKKEAGFENRDEIETMFDYIEADEEIV